MSEVRDPATDQPLPIPSGLPYAHDVLIEEIKKRRALGVEKYGHALQPHNGRNQKRDILDELLDAAIYTINLMLEEGTTEYVVVTDTAERRFLDVTEVRIEDGVLSLMDGDTVRGTFPLTSVLTVRKGVTE